MERQMIKMSERTVRKQLQWLRVLLDADPNDNIARAEMERLQAEHPDVETPQGDGELVQWGKMGRVTERDSPFSPQELLSRPAAEWIDDLLDSLAGQHGMIQRDGLEIAIKQACAQKPEWGIELALALKSRDLWDTALWDHVLYAWHEELGEETYSRTMDIVLEPNILQRYQWHVASILGELTRNGGKPYLAAVLPKANIVAEKLGDYVDDSTSDAHDNYLGTAINHPSGVLAGFWLVSLSTWLSSQDPRPSELPEDYRGRLSKIVADESLSGLVGKTILCSRLPFLYISDQNWTVENLIPLLTDFSNGQQSQAVWHGLVYATQFWPELLERLEKGFQNAARRMRELFEPSGIRNRFIDRYALVTVNFAQNPIGNWIPPFFEGATESKDRANFAFYLRTILNRMNQEKHRRKLWERLLRPYWQNRLDGVPSYEPDRSELGYMAEWLPLLPEECLVEAVKLATEKQWGWENATILSHNLETDERGFWRGHPEETASLLIHVDSSQQVGPRWEWSGKATLIQQLLENPGLNAAKKRALRDLATRLGLT